MAKKKKAESITISKVAVWQGVSAVLAVLLIVSITTGGFTGSETGAPAPVARAAAGTGTGTTTSGGIEVNLEGAHVLGSEDALITLVEWSDFQCLFCKRHFEQTKPLLIQNYIDQGLVRLVFKHFPLDSIHPMARPAALAAECAGEQGKFWEYHDQLFEKMDSLSPANFKAWAAAMGLNTGQFNNCYDTGKYADKVEADLQEGIRAGVRGTPGFILEGQLISGAQPYQVFQAAIDSALA